MIKKIRVAMEQILFEQQQNRFFASFKMGKRFKAGIRPVKEGAYVQVSTRTGIEHEETLLSESAARETSLNSQIIETGVYRIFASLGTPLHSRTFRHLQLVPSVSLKVVCSSVQTHLSFRWTLPLKVRFSTLVLEFTYTLQYRCRYIWGRGVFYIPGILPSKPVLCPNYIFGKSIHIVTVDIFR